MALAVVIVDIWGSIFPSLGRFAIDSGIHEEPNIQTKLKKP